MDLWIRSQDKSNLKKVNNIYAEKIEKDFESWVDNIYCRPYVITSDNGNLGFYATKERALEVLDEIQEHLDYLNIGHIDRTDEKGFRVCSIYNMPKE